jgi:hypothetical protein
MPASENVCRRPWDVARRNSHDQIQGRRHEQQAPWPLGRLLVAQSGDGIELGCTARRVVAEEEADAQGD